MIDVLHVISGLGTGGAEMMLAQLAGLLRTRGLSQHVVSLSAHDALAADLRGAGVEVTVCGARSAIVIPRAMSVLLGAVNSRRPRILQGWMYHGDLAASVSHNLCAGKRDRKVFWNLRASNMDTRRYGGIVRMSALLSSQVDVAIANSQAGIAFHRNRGFRPRRLELIDNGIDIEKFRPDAETRRQVRAELAICDDAIVVINVARVDPMKDHSNFIAAMARLPSVTALMVGSGTESLNALPNMRVLGLRRDVARLFAAADIVASSSAFGEGFSNVVAEGMSAGLVPLATDVGDARRIVGDTGSIVPPSDPRAFADAITAIAELPAAERQRRGLAARERIATHFTLDLAAQAYARLYAEA